MLTIALIPSAALLVTGASVAGDLTSEGLSARNFSSYFGQLTGQLVQVETATENERTLSLRALGGDRQALAGLQAQWNTTDAVTSALVRTATNAGQALNPQLASSGLAAFHELAVQWPQVRQEVRTRRATAAEVDTFYTKLVGLGSPTYLRNALGAPTSAAAVDATTAMDLMPAIDLHSPAAGLGESWAERGVLSQSERLTVAQLAGAYRNQLEDLAFRLTPAEQGGAPAAGAP